MSRKLTNWLTSYMEYVEETEPSDAFKMGVGLWTMAGALQRKCWLMHGDYAMYPNLYIVLTGPPGEARKTTAVRVGIDLLSTLNSFTDTERPYVLLSAHKITPEALVKWAAETPLTNETPDGETVISHNSISLAAGELATFFGQENHALIALMNDWFDCPVNWENKTIGRGQEIVPGTWFNLLGGATPTYLSQIFPANVIETGITSRIIFVYSEEKGKDVAIPRLGDREGNLFRALKADLHHIFQNMVGPIHHTPETTEWWETFYYNKPRWKTIQEPKLAGFCSRKPLHLLKLATIFHASRSDAKTMDVEDLERAEEYLLSLEPTMPRALGEIANNAEAVLLDRIFSTIKGSPEGRALSKAAILRQHLGDGDGFQITRALATLTEMQLVEARKNPDDITQPYYRIRAVKAEQASTNGGLRV